MEIHQRQKLWWQTMNSELVLGFLRIVVKNGNDDITAAATAGIAAAPVAAIEAYRAHSFEKKFWEFISTTISEIGKGEAKMSSPVAITS